MPRDYLPAADAALTEWLFNFHLVLVNTSPLVGVTAADLTKINEIEVAWANGVTGRQQALATARAATAAKRLARADAVKVIRKLVARIQTDPAVTDTLRAQLAITQTTALPIGKVSREVPSVVPLLILDAGVRGQIGVKFGPNPGNARLNGLPTPAKGGVVQWRAVPAAGEPGVWTWIDNASRSPFIHAHGLPALTRVEYRVAYLYSRGRRGPWSAPVDAAAMP